MKKIYDACSKLALAIKNAIKWPLTSQNIGIKVAIMIIAYCMAILYVIEAIVTVHVCNP